MRKLITFFCFLFAFTVPGYSEDQNFDNMNQEKIRIFSLLPENLLVALAIEPRIPDNFVAMNSSGKLDAFDWTYWGPKDVLEAYFKDEKSLSRAIIRVKLGQISQNDVMHPDRTKMINGLKAMGFTTFDDIQFTWGIYPGYAIYSNSSAQALHTAWIGLNAEGDWTMQFQLIYPLSQQTPSLNDLQLWRDFLEHTQQLPEPLFFIANGQNLQDGYTLVNAFGSKLKAVAEKRARDNKLQIVVMPLADNVSFKFEEAGEGLMGAKWHFREPLAKVYGMIHRKDGNSELYDSSCISILIKMWKNFL